MIAPLQGAVGQTIVFEGYADDYGNHIVALEFSLDNGRTWVSQDTSDSDPNLMIHWTYSYTPTEPGQYRLKVRSVTEDGRVSPLPAVADLYVDEAPPC